MVSEDVFLHTKQKISISTLKRLFGFVNGVQDPRLYTLDILAKYLGFNNWDVYLEEIKSNCSSEFFNIERIDVESLALETKIKIAYEPNRIIELNYVGDFYFKIETTVNSKLQVGDIVKITNFVKNFPLFISEVKRNNQNLGQYRAGKSGGLSELKLLNNLHSIDAGVSDFENDTNYSIYFNPKQNTKTLVQASKYSSTFKFKSHNKWLCVKLLNEEYLTDGMYVDTFENEFNIGYELNHSNIIQYYNLVRTLDIVYILKEYVDGFALKEYLLQYTTTTTYFSALHAVLLQLIDVLHYIHTKQIYHLDIKPANILITSKGNNVKLIDFGFSTRDNHDYYPAGTKNYSSPEQRKSISIIDGRSVIYALGKTLDELIRLPKRKGILYFFNWIKYKMIIKKCISENQTNRFNHSTETI